MKKRGKRLLAITLASLMSLSTITGWANTAEIVSVKIGDNAAVTSNINGANLGDVTPADTVVVKVKINDATPAAIAGAEATFLAALSTAFEASGTLGNNSIQYVDQQTTVAVEGETDPIATFTFRPRVDASGQATHVNANTAKVGGTDVSEVQSFTYNVTNAKKAMTVTLAANADNKISADATENVNTIAYTIGGDEIPADLTSVKINGSALTKTTDYTYADGTLTILATYLQKNNGFAQGKAYDLTVEAAGYENGVLASAIVVKFATDEDAEEVVSGAETEIATSNPAPEVDNNNNAVVTMPTTTTGGYDYEYEAADDASVPEGVTIEDNKIVLDTTKAPFAAVQIEVKVAGTDKVIPKTVYVITKEQGKEIGFGNFNLKSKNNEDAFKYDATATDDANNTAFEAAIEGVDALKEKTTALSFALNPDTATGLPHFEGAFDFDGNNTFALAEYRLYKLMMDYATATEKPTDDTYSFGKVNAFRATLNQN